MRYWVGGQLQGGNILAEATGIAAGEKQPLGHRQLDGESTGYGIKGRR